MKENKDMSIFDLNWLSGIGLGLSIRECYVTFSTLYSYGVTNPWKNVQFYPANRVRELMFTVGIMRGIR